MTTGIEQPLESGPLRPSGRAPALRRKLQKKLAELEQLGVGGVLRKAFRDHVYRTRECVILELRPDPDQHEVTAAKDLMVIGRDDAMPDFHRHFGAQAAGYEATIRAGGLCFAAVKDGAVVGVCFCSFEDYFEPSDGVWFPVRDGEAYFFGWLVPPDQRSFANAAGLVRYSTAYLAARGLRRLYCAVDSWNTRSLGSLLFIGYREAGELIRVHRFLRWSWTTREAYAEPRFARFQRKRRSAGR